MKTNEAASAPALRSPSGKRGRSHGFTLVEMLVVIGIIGILAGMLMPALGRAKAKAHQIKCISNLRQLGFGLTLYAGDYDGEFPSRKAPPNAWPHKLKPYYVDWSLITCPSDKFGVGGLYADEINPNRSFLINGFNDYFMNLLEGEDYQKYQHWDWPHGMREVSIPKPSETVIFGEKRSGSFHVHMDLDQGRQGNDYEEIEYRRHTRGSDFVFGDASARLLRREQVLFPENLWAVTDEFRHPPAEPK